MKILVVRVGRAGDMVMITPALNALLAAYPSAELHILTGAEGRRILGGYHPAITRFLPYRTGSLYEFFDRNRLRREIAEQRYSRAYVFEAHPRFQDLIQSAVSVVYLLHYDPPTVHYCERALQVVRCSLDSPARDGWITLPVTEEGRNRAREYLKRNGIAPGTRIAGFHATSSSSRLLRKKRSLAHRWWPPEAFGRLAQLLQESARDRNIPLQIVMDVLPAERQLVEPIAGFAPGIVRILPAEPDFERYKGILERMEFLVTPDTGPMHVAAALGTPVVALFSRKSPAECGPFVPPERKRVFRAEDSPRPDLGLAGITPDSILPACLGFLK
jgi:heptosyltransferase I